MSNWQVDDTTSHNPQPTNSGTTQFGPGLRAPD